MHVLVQYVLAGLFMVRGCCAKVLPDGLVGVSAVCDLDCVVLCVLFNVGCKGSTGRATMLCMVRLLHYMLHEGVGNLCVLACWLGRGAELVNVAELGCLAAVPQGWPPFGSLNLAEEDTSLRSHQHCSQQQQCGTSTAFVTCGRCHRPILGSGLDWTGSAIDGVGVSQHSVLVCHDTV
jgi:hypothetical protein